jgi:hypothetical protein
LKDPDPLVVEAKDTFDRGLMVRACPLDTLQGTELNLNFVQDFLYLKNFEV